MKQPLKILFASYEVAPFFKFGGLADVAGSLPKALKKLGADMRVIMPYYGSIKRNYPNLKKYKSNLSIKLANQELNINILKSALPKSKAIIYFIDCPEYFQVKNIFDGSERIRFITFSYLIAQIIKNNYLNWQPQIVHCNDWQTGMLPIFIKQHKKIKTLFTIHNIGYAGRTELNILEKFGFKADDFSQIKDNQVNIIHQAILSSHKISTVSPNYAREILTPEYGYDMADALRLRQHDLSGIINGVDYDNFNPAVDKDIKVKYDLKTIKHKLKNKLYLQKISGLPQDKNIPVIGMVSRLAGQKGFDILIEAFEQIMRLNLQLIILGTGAKEYQQFFTKVNKRYSAKFKAHLTFDLKLARQIYAGADIFLMPSKYEPGGLGQLIAMKYGTVPVVRATGGLKDTVKKSTGFSFKEYSSRELLKVIKQTLQSFNNQRVWSRLIKNSMQKDFSWNHSAKEYLKLYTKLVK